MKSITKSLLIGAAAVFALSQNISAQCSGYTYFPENQQIGWESSNYYPIITLDASTLTDATKYPRTGAADGKADNLNFGDQTLKAPTGDGFIELPLMDYKDGAYVESGYNYNVKFVRCVFAPTHYGSAYTKIEEWQEEASGKNDACTRNDNTALIGNVYSKKGFIEISRQSYLNGAPEGVAANSLCGYIQLDDLHGVEKIQWSYSSTSWKRGVICEVRYGGEGEEWLPSRVIPSDVNSYATFAEQGYEFEETIGAEDSGSWEVPVSVRFRIFDCDTITFAKEYENGETNVPGYYYKPTSAFQAVRIHEIKVFSALKGSEMYQYMTPTGINDMVTDELVISKLGSTISLTSECDVEIYTVDGKLYKQARGKNISTWGMPKGLYIIKATSLENGAVKNVKMPF